MTVQLTKSQRTRIKRAITSLNNVRAEIEKDHPGSDINWYLEDTSHLNLMNGQSHGDEGAHYDVAKQENVIECFDLDKASGGAW